MSNLSHESGAFEKYVTHMNMINESFDLVI